MRRLHLMFRFEEADVSELAELRHRWDPVMAAKVPPHVTLTYPQELRDEAVLVERGQAAAALVGEFSLSTLTVGTDNDDGASGVWIELADTSGSWTRLRDMIVPGDQVKVGPHLTIVHPRTSDQGPTAWTELQDWRGDLTLPMSEFLLIATESEESNEILHRFPLTRT